MHSINSSSVSFLLDKISLPPGELFNVTCYFLREFTSILRCQHGATRSIRIINFICFPCTQLLFVLFDLLQLLDLSRNQLSGFDDAIATRLGNIGDVKLENNPLICDRCHMGSLIAMAKTVSLPSAIILFSHSILYYMGYVSVWSHHRNRKQTITVCMWTGTPEFLRSMSIFDI